MTSEPSSPRFPWGAIALSFLSSGLGHIYCGHIVKGLFLYSARLLLPLLCIFAAFLHPSQGTLFGLILIPAAILVLLYLYAPIDAYLIARRTGSDYKLKEYNRSALYCVLIAMHLTYPFGLLWGTREYVYEAFLIPTRSMSPTFLAGDRILANKRPIRNGFPERGDVVVFRAPASETGQTWIKRVIAVSGDRIEINGNQIKVNGKELVRELVPTESLSKIRNQVKGDVFYEVNAGRRYRVLFDEMSADAPEPKAIEFLVPARSVFVLGDNRNRSKDSRHIGAIHIGDVLGTVDYLYWPAESWSRFGPHRD